MANKKQVHYNLKRLKQVKTWQLIVLLVLCSFISATFLRLNNIGMVERRSAVLSADKVGDNDRTRDRLYDLQRYVSSHMNTNMDKGVYLESTYRKDVQKIYEAASVDSNPNGNIYKKAQEVCAPQFSSWSDAYIQCTINEIEKYPASVDLISSVQIPKADSYRHVYTSPLWSPDFAGWSVLICVVILIMILFRFIGVIILKIILHHRYKTI